MKTLSFEKILANQLKDPELNLMFEEKKFFLQIAQLISSLRQAKGMTQTQLAKSAKISQPMLARLESGDQKRYPTFLVISRVLKALGYQLELKVVEKRKKAA